VCRCAVDLGAGGTAAQPTLDEAAAAGDPRRGQPSIDRLFEVRCPGGITAPEAFVALPGGKANVARAACLGEPVHAVALVGGNAGASSPKDWVRGDRRHLRSARRDAPRRCLRSIAPPAR
jgi:hypothetical protein